MIIYEGPNALKKIYLVKVDDHYHGCTSLSGFLERSYFCEDCNKGYSKDNRHHHPCKKIWCFGCQKKGCSNWDEAKKNLLPGEWPKYTHRCSDCNRAFYGPQCYIDHKKETATDRSLCQRFKGCPACKCEHNVAPKKKEGKRKTNPSTDTSVGGEIVLSVEKMLISRLTNVSFSQFRPKMTSQNYTR